ncbi:hypothetical protein NC651_029166 [Populus alba x Populus x berolinensis]|nr:hypothetical protein NC651_029166 [Populus alba x Populus x berolinensis]
MVRNLVDFTAVFETNETEKMHWVLDSQCSSYSLTRESFLRLHYHFSLINSNYKTATSPTRWKRLTKMFSLKRFSVSR